VEPALDIDCGSSGRFIDLLIKHGFPPEGLDVSKQMIELARKRHPDVNFYHADISKWTFPKKYDFISAWDSTWHLPLPLQEPVLQKICDGLADNGVFVFTTAALDAPHEKSDSSMGIDVWYGILGISKTLELLDRLGCVCRHLEYDQFPEQHLYIVAQKRPFIASRSSPRN
jgi:SAM-dependent methyltransferase